MWLFGWVQGWGISICAFGAGIGTLEPSLIDHFVGIVVASTEACAVTTNGPVNSVAYQRRAGAAAEALRDGAGDRASRSPRCAPVPAWPTKPRPWFISVGHLRSDAR